MVKLFYKLWKVRGDHMDSLRLESKPSQHSHVFCFCVAVFVEIAALCSGAHADSYAPIRNTRTASDNGSYYVILKRDGENPHEWEWGPMNFEYVQANETSIPPETVGPDVEDDPRAEKRYKYLPHPDVEVRPQDRIIARDRINDPPTRLLVSSSGLGFIAIDRYGYNCFDNAPEVECIRIFGKDGNLKHRLTLDQLVGPEKATEMFEKREVSTHLYWFRAGWIDETNRSVVVVFPDCAIKKVSLDNGKVSNGVESDISIGLRQRLPERVSDALEVVYETKPKYHLPSVRHILTQRNLTPDVRSRALLILATADEPGAKNQLKQFYSAASTKDERRYYVTSRLKDALGNDAASLIPEILQDGTQYSAMFDLIESLGLSDYKTIEACLSNPAPAVRLKAVSVLSRFGPKALAAAKRAESDTDEKVRDAARKFILKTENPSKSTKQN